MIGYHNEGDWYSDNDMAASSSSSSHRRQPRSPASAGVEATHASPSSPPPTTGRLSTVTSPRLQLSSSTSSDSAGSSPRPRKHETGPRTPTADGGVTAAVPQRQSTVVRRVLSDTADGGTLPVWRGANMAQSQLIQRRRRQLQLQTQHKTSRAVHRTSVTANKRSVSGFNSSGVISVNHWGVSAIFA